MAANKIKGLTVEIGGDTTKLGKALESVNKKSRDLSSELGEINKMLKFDPGNADLLAQKQKVLAEAVANTAAKLKTLKDAEAQVQKQFERGEVSEDQMRALQREIMDTERKLGSYEKAAKETAEAIQRLGNESGDVKRGTNAVEKGADEASDSLDDLADSAERAEKSGDGLGTKLGGVVKNGLKAVAAAATAAVGALVGAAEASREYRTAMGKLDTAFETAGHSSQAATNTYKSLQGVLGDTDQAVEASNHLAKLCKGEKDLSKWTDIATGVYATFGDSLPIENLTEAANETTKTGKITGGLADALNWAGESEDEFQAKLDACSSEQERQALITDTLNGLYTEAADKYRETNAEVIKANEANEEWASVMAEVGEAMEPVLTTVKELGASIVSDLLPGIKGVTEALKGLLSGEAGAAKDLGESLSGIITQLLEKIQTLAPAIAEAAVSLVTTLVTTLVSMIPDLVETGVQLILSVLDGIVQAIPQLVAAIADAIPRLVSVLETALPQIIEGIVSVVNSLIDNLDQILEPLIASLPRVVMTLVNALLDNLPAVIDGIIKLIMTLLDYLPDIIAAILEVIPQIITAVCDSLAENIPTILNAIIDIISKLATETLPRILVEIAKALPSILGSILLGLGKILVSIVLWFSELLGKVGEGLGNIIKKVIAWGVELGKKSNEAMAKFFKNIWNVLKQLPGKVWEWLKKVVTKVATWAVNMQTKAKEAMTKFLNSVINTVKQLPSKVWTWLKNTAAKVVSWGAELVSKARSAITKMVKTVIDKVKELPGKMKTAGKNLVEGLWNGIKEKVNWLKNKIKGWVGNVLSFIKKLFGIKSPSRETAWMGEMLDEGFAKGIEDNARTPLKAIDRLSQGMLDEAEQMNGLTLERRLNSSLAPSVASQGEGILDKLDRIYQAILSGQVIMLDGATLVGSTVGNYDSKLGERRVLAERGAL